MTCPICNSMLKVGYHREGHELAHYVVWCANGKCPDKRTNDGGTGSTEWKAFEDLLNKIDEAARNQSEVSK